MMRTRFTWMALVTAVLALLVLPTTARAQSAFAGIVKDATGAVLPGVTVEAASPALIEQVRSANTDANGAYKIENLRPGVYTSDVFTAGFLNGQEGRPRTPIELHRDHQHRVEGRRGRRNGDGLRRIAGRRRAEQQQGSGAAARSARRGAYRPHDSGRRSAGRRRDADGARRRRIAGDAANLLHRARPWRCANLADDGRHDHQRPAG